MKHEFFSRFFLFLQVAQTNQLNIIFIIISNNRFLRLPTSFSVILVSETQNYFLSVAFILYKKQLFPLDPVFFSFRKMLGDIIIIILFLTRNPRGS